MEIIKNPKTTTTPSQITNLNHVLFADQESSRSYTCGFCKRGFSNAQALGGHMNVHRKDRARLQESYQETLITTKLGVNSNSFDQLEVQSSDDEKSESESAPKRSWTMKKPTLQLSLCIAPSCTTSDKSSCSTSTEVDLELRLGMDAQTSSRGHVVKD